MSFLRRMELLLVAVHISLLRKTFSTNTTLKSGRGSMRTFMSLQNLVRREAFTAYLALETFPMFLHVPAQ